MPFAALPDSAAWCHRGARVGFEVAYFRPADSGYRIDGCTTAVEDGLSWVVEYGITLDAAGATAAPRSAAERWPDGPLCPRPMFVPPAFPSDGSNRHTCGHPMKTHTGATTTAHRSSASRAGWSMTYPASS